MNPLQALRVPPPSRRPALSIHYRRHIGRELMHLPFESHVIRPDALLGEMKKCFGYGRISPEDDAVELS